jgi:deoxyadenosine/deoxycytidine kinase
MSFLSALIPYPHRHPWFLTPLQHGVLLFALLTWNPNWRVVLIYAALVIVARFTLLYFWVLWTFIRLTFVIVVEGLQNIFYFLFRFMPTDSNTAERMVEQHVLVGKLCLLEGNIAVGKTTVVRELAKCPVGEIIQEGIPQDMLADFNRTHDGNAFQLRLGVKRITDIVRCATELAVCTANPARMVNELGSHRKIVDRSIIGCRAFAFYNYVIGNLSGTTLDTYLMLSSAELKQFFEEKMNGVKVVVLYMPVPAHVCKERLMKRTGPDQGTTEQYLLGISLMHALVLINLLRSHPRSVRVLLYESSASSDYSVRGCVCQRLKKATLLGPSTLAPLENFSGVLDLNLAERERLEKVMRDYLTLAPKSVDCINERKWIETLYEIIGRQSN